MIGRRAILYAVGDIVLMSRPFFRGTFAAMTLLLVVSIALALIAEAATASRAMRR